MLVLYYSVNLVYKDLNGLRLLVFVDHICLENIFDLNLVLLVNSNSEVYLIKLLLDLYLALLVELLKILPLVLPMTLNETLWAD